MAQLAKPKTREIKRDSAAVKQSAKAIEHSANDLTDSADRRTTLAGDRTLLAAERTYAAWVRTALAALASGVGTRALMKDLHPERIGKLTGSVLVMFAGFCLVAAVWREIRGTPAPPTPDLRTIPASLLVPINGFLMLVALAALVGIWAD